MARLVAPGTDPGSAVADGQGGRSADAGAVGELLFALVNVARSLGVDPESALRTTAAAFRTTVDEHG